MGKSVSKLGVTIPDKESYVYSAYFQATYSGPTNIQPTYETVYNTFPSTPTWTRVGTGKIESSGFGIPMTAKNTQEVIISKVPYQGTEGFTDNWNGVAGLKAGGGGIQVNTYDSSYLPNDSFGSFYLRVTVYV